MSSSRLRLAAGVGFWTVVALACADLEKSSPGSGQNGLGTQAGQGGSGQLDPASPWQPGSPFVPLDLGRASAPLCGGASKKKEDGKTAGGVDDNSPGGTGAGGSSGSAPPGGGSAGKSAGAAGKGGPIGQAGAAGGGNVFGAGGGTGQSGEFAGGAAGAAGSPIGVDAGAPCIDDAGADADADADTDASCPPAAPPPAPKHQPAPSGVCEGVDLTMPARLYLSSDDSNSMAAPAIVRSLIRDGARDIQQNRLFRTHEFLNYYRFSYGGAEPGKLGLTVQGGSCEGSDDLALQIAVQSPPPPDSLPPISLTLVLDTSGSMAEVNAIDRERAAVKAIASVLRAGDRVNAVTWATDQTPVLQGYTVTGSNDPTLVGLANSLEANGGTDFNAGLAAGYKLAKAHYLPGSINRVVVISDGIANVGVTNEKTIGEMADDKEAEGIYLVGIGVGKGVNDTLLDAVTDAGRGAYVYLDTAQEAQKMLVERFSETMLVAARDVQIAMTLPPYFNIQKFSGEIFSTDPTKVRPQHLAPDDTMLLYQIVRPCDASLVNGNDPLQVDVTWKDPVDGSSRSVSRRSTLNGLQKADGNMLKAAVVVAYVGVLREMRLASTSGRLSMLSKTIDLVDEVDPSGADPDLVEIKGLLQKLKTNQ